MDETRAVLDIFRMRGLPVVLVNVAGRRPGGLNRDLVPVAHLRGRLTSRLQLPNDVAVTKRTWGAVRDTDLDDRLKALGVTRRSSPASPHQEASRRRRAGPRSTPRRTRVPRPTPPASGTSRHARRDGHKPRDHRSPASEARLRCPGFRSWAYFFGGVFLGNAIPHVVNGMMAEPIQRPFAKPPGEGLSSSTVKVLWGFFNIVKCVTVVTCSTVC
jgi:hypothetical protein